MMATLETGACCAVFVWSFKFDAMHGSCSRIRYMILGLDSLVAQFAYSQLQKTPTWSASKESLLEVATHRNDMVRRGFVCGFGFANVFH